MTLLRKNKKSLTISMPTNNLKVANNSCITITVTIEFAPDILLKTKRDIRNEINHGIH